MVCEMGLCDLLGKQQTRLFADDKLLSLFGFGWLLCEQQVFSTRNWLVRSLTRWW